jgi:hypothetical protein
MSRSSAGSGGVMTVVLLHAVHILQAAAALKGVIVRQ